MAYRNIFIANTSKLSTGNEQLIVDNGEEYSVQRYENVVVPLQFLVWYNDVITISTLNGL